MQIKRNIMIDNAGGTASKNGKTYRVSIPANMIRQIGVSEMDRAVILECENNEIKIRKDKAEG